jgi:hypothetical protein
MAESDLTLLITQQLMARGIRVMPDTFGATNIQAFCYRGHDKASASLSIRKSDGAFYCFGGSCGVHGPDWNTLARAIGADELSEENRPDGFGLMLDKMKQDQEEASFLPALPWDTTPWTTRWRGMSGAFLQRVGALHWFDERLRCPRILFPFNQQGDLAGWVARRTDGHDENMKYRNMPRIKSSEKLFPLDTVEQILPKTLARTKTVVLVEGPVDALRLMYYKIPALAILGTKNWKPEIKLNLIGTLGVTRCIVAMDNDRGGNEVQDTIFQDVGQRFRAEQFRPPEGKDPGGMPLKEVHRLRRQVLSG